MDTLPSTQPVSCILMDGFSSLAYASATAPLTAFNRITGDHYYRTDFYGYDTEVVSDSAQTIQVKPISQAIQSSDGPSMVIVCGGSPSAYPNDSQLIEDIHKLKRSARFLIGIGTGGYALARSGILNHRKASIHWWNLASIKEQFPSLQISTDLFSIDGNIATCRAGTAALDLMITLIGRMHGNPFVDALTQHFLRERFGESNQTVIDTNIDSKQQLQQPKLVEAITLMENNIKEPLSTEEIAYHVALSRRQLERLFKQHIKTVPSRYYLQIRLEKARAALLSSNDSITLIAHAFGFSSSAHFSTRYRNLFGLTPTEDRSMNH